jgi:hypothetical protein
VIMGLQQPQQKMTSLFGCHPGESRGPAAGGHRTLLSIQLCTPL